MPTADKPWQMLLLLLDKCFRFCFLHKKTPKNNFLFTPSCTGIYICTIKKNIPRLLNITFSFQRKNDDTHSHTLTSALICRHKQKSGLQTHVWDKINRWLIFFLKKRKSEGKEKKRANIQSINSTAREMNRGGEQREDTKPDRSRRREENEERLFLHVFQPSLSNNSPS